MSLLSESGDSSRQLKLWSNLLSVYLLWGSTYLFIHFMTEKMPPLYMAGWRLLVAGGLLYSFARIKGSPRPSVKEGLSAVAVGILLLGFSMGGMSVAIQYIPTGIAALLAGLLPLFLIVINWIGFDRSRPGNLAIAGLLLGLAGIVMLVKPGSFKATSADSWIGIVIIIFCNMFWAVGTLLSARLKLPQQLVSSSVQMLAGGFVLLGTSLIFEPVSLFSISDAPAKAIGALFYLVIFGSILGFTSYAWLARNAPPQLLATYAYVNPVVAMILGWSFAGEQVNSQAFFAIVAILFGVILISAGKRS